MTDATETLNVNGDDLADVPLMMELVLHLAGDERDNVEPILGGITRRLALALQQEQARNDELSDAAARALELAQNPSEDYASAVAAAQRSGELRGHRVGYAEGHAAGKAEAEAARPSTVATVQRIERDESGKPVAITEQMEDGTVRRKALSYSEDGRLVGIESVSS
jgi:hypothetical protein